MFTSELVVPEPAPGPMAKYQRPARTMRITTTPRSSPALDPPLPSLTTTVFRSVMWVPFSWGLSIAPQVCRP